MSLSLSLALSVCPAMSLSVYPVSICLSQFLSLYVFVCLFCLCFFCVCFITVCCISVCLCLSLNFSICLCWLLHIMPLSVCSVSFRRWFHEQLYISFSTFELQSLKVFDVHLNLEHLHNLIIYASNTLKLHKIMFKPIIF